VDSDGTKGWDVMRKNQNGIPGTLTQAIRLLEIIKEGKLNSAQVQRLIEMPGVIAELAKVEVRPNIHAIRSLLNNPEPIFWTPVQMYPRLVAERAKERKWPISQMQINQLELGLRHLDHFRPYYPIGLDIWLGNIELTALEAILWIYDWFSEKSAPTIYFDCKTIKDANHECLGNRPEIKVRRYDLATFRYTERTDHIANENISWARDFWPGTDGLYLIAMNPQYFSAIDYEIVPSLRLIGLDCDRGDSSIPGTKVSFNNSSDPFTTCSIKRCEAKLEEGTAILAYEQS
jgi:hypothetical protein